MGVEYFSSVTTRAILLVVGAVLVSGCGGGQLRRTPMAERDTPWFCQMNEARSDWECVRDAELARNPRPERLPTDDIPEPEIIDASIPLIAPTVSFEPEAPEASAEGPDGDGDVTATAAAAAASVDSAAEASTAAAAAEPPPSETQATPEALSAPDLLSLDPDAYAIQLIAVASADLADEFVTDYQIDDALTVRLARDGEPFYVVLLGIYENYGDAQYVADHRNENLATLEPWIRPLSSIQEGIRAAEGLVATSE
jgi:DamX protein